MDESKVRKYIQKLEQANLLRQKGDSIVIKGIEVLDEYLRYIALKEKFEKI
jgi:hypothetical protein